MCYCIIDLPDDVLIEVLVFILEYPVLTSCTASKVCRRWRNALQDESLWKRHYFGRFKQRKRRRSSFREEYADNHMLETSFTYGNFSARQSIQLNSAVTQIRLADDGSCIAGNSRGGISIYHDLSHIATPTKTTVISAESPVTCLYSSSGTVYVGFKNGCLSSFSKGLDAIQTVQHGSSSITSLVELSNAFVATSADGLTRLLSKSSLTPISLYSSAEPPSCSSALSETVYCVGAKDRRVRVYDTRSGSSPIATSCLLADWVLCVEGGMTELRASDRSVQWFDLRAGLHAITSSMHCRKRMITKFKTEPGFRLVSCGLDGDILVSSLEVQTQLPVNRVSEMARVSSESDYLLSLDFDQRRIVYSGIAGNLDVLHFDN